MLLRKAVYRVLATAIKNNKKATCSIRELSTSKEENVVIKDKYDIIIAGGGMVGCSLACAMAKNSLLSNFKILLLEGSPHQKYEPKATYSNRVVALNQNTKALMNSLNVWSHIENIRLQPIRQMQVWDACSDALISFDSADMYDDDLAYIVENDLVLHAVNTELTANNPKNLDIVYGAKISGYNLAQTTKQPTNNLVHMSNGDVYSCELLIGADGANSAVRKAMGVQYLSWNYDQMGVVATLELAEETENTIAWQRWLPTGPVALLPLDSKHSSLVWSAWNDEAKRLLTLSDGEFVDTLNEALWKQYPRSSGVEACVSWFSARLREAGLPDGATRMLPPSVCSITPGSRAAFPLGFGHSSRYIAPGVVLIGDAAHRVHPLAGQGVNLGFGDVKQLVQSLSDALYAGYDVSHHEWMEKYETVRQLHNVPTQLATDALQRLYCTEIAPVVLARSIGLQITNALTPLKKMIISHATT